MVYETLTVWMQCLGGASGTEMYATSVIRNAVVDCSPSVDASKVVPAASMRQLINIF
jgi:hypothetical protein